MPIPFLGSICNETLGRRVNAGDFIVFVGEFSLQAQLNNTLAGRQAIYDSQVRAFQQYLSGGAFWTDRFDVSACHFAPKSTMSEASAMFLLCHRASDLSMGRELR